MDTVVRSGIASDFSGERRGLAGVNFQLTILKVLAGHPEGRASFADLKQFVAVLICSGDEWAQRMKRLAARAPGLDIFSSKYVVRDATGWRITNGGRTFLNSIETPPAEEAPTEPDVLQPLTIAVPDRLPNVIQIATHQSRRRHAA